MHLKLRDESLRSYILALIPIIIQRSTIDDALIVACGQIIYIPVVSQLLQDTMNSYFNACPPCKVLWKYVVFGYF